MFEKNTSDMQWFCFKIRHLIKLKLLFLHILCNVVKTITRDIMDLIKLISSVANKLGKIWGFHFKVCWWRHQPVWHQNPWFEPFQVEILWQRKAKVQTITATYIKLTLGYSKASLIFVARINWTNEATMETQDNIKPKPCQVGPILGVFLLSLFLYGTNKLF